MYIELKHKHVTVIDITAIFNYFIHYTETKYNDLYDNYLMEGNSIEVLYSYIIKKLLHDELHLEISQIDTTKYSTMLNIYFDFTSIYKPHTVIKEQLNKIGINKPYRKFFDVLVSPFHVYLSFYDL